MKVKLRKKKQFEKSDWHGLKTCHTAEASRKVPGDRQDAEMMSS